MIKYKLLKNKFKIWTVLYISIKILEKYGYADNCEKSIYYNQLIHFKTFLFKHFLSMDRKDFGTKILISFYLISNVFSAEYDEFWKIIFKQY